MWLQDQNIHTVISPGSLPQLQRGLRQGQSGPQSLSPQHAPLQCRAISDNGSRSILGSAAGGPYFRAHLTYFKIRTS